MAFHSLAVPGCMLVVRLATLAVLEYRSDNLFHLNRVHSVLAMNTMSSHRSVDNSEAQLL